MSYHSLVLEGANGNLFLKHQFRRLRPRPDHRLLRIQTQAPQLLDKTPLPSRLRLILGQYHGMQCSMMPLKTYQHLLADGAELETGTDA